MSEKRIAVVTGGNRGIGLEICRQLARREDLHVVLTSRDVAKGQAAVAQLAAEGLEVTAFQLDTTSAADISALAAWLQTTYGRVDILVNNAGVLLDQQRGQGSVFAAELDTIKETMDSNVYGPLLLCQALVPLMKENGYGRIVNV
ncbi:MAG: SDR family NAD(P)-dependent oxidoreductase, partial [Candidatus Sericytochromatia bacterium]